MMVSKMNDKQRGMFDAAVAGVTAMKRAEDAMQDETARKTLARQRRAYTREAALIIGCQVWDIREAAKTRIKHGE